jgi:hypothetical protein
MSGVGRLRASVAMAALCATIAGCAPTAPTVQYHNVDHPNYSVADFNRDSVQCRDQNSTKQVIPGYEDKLVVTVDEPKAKACLATKGWQPN